MNSEEIIYSNNDNTKHYKYIKDVNEGRFGFVKKVRRLEGKKMYKI